MHVSLRAGLVVLPARAAVGGAHEAAELDPGEDQVGVVRVRRDPAHVRRPRPRREAPRRPRRELEQCVERLPALASVVASEEPARLGAGVDGAVGRADRQRSRRRPRGGRSRPSFGRRLSIVARRPPTAPRTRCRVRPGRPRGTRRRARAATTRPSTRRPVRSGPDAVAGGGVEARNAGQRTRYAGGRRT